MTDKLLISSQLCAFVSVFAQLPLLASENQKSVIITCFKTAAAAEQRGQPERILHCF